MTGRRPVPVGVIGAGTIGTVVATELQSGQVDGASLAGVARRHPGALGIEELIERSEVIVEAAGAAVIADHGSAILASGRDLLIVSTGALTEQAVFDELRAAGPGRLLLCGGAVGGIDMIRSAVAMGPIEQAGITTTKKPAGLVQDHMTEQEQAALLGADGPMTLFEGPARELVARFPASTNVTATLALAVGDWGLVTGSVRADPEIERTSHVIEMTGAAGAYRFDMSNHPSPTNPRSSGVVGWSVVRALSDHCGSSWRFV